MEAVPLSSQPARTDLTDRECTKLLGGTLGALATMTDKSSLLRAIQWWANNPNAISALYKLGAPR